jgi:hypothetical protein
MNEICGIVGLAIFISAIVQAIIGRTYVGPKDQFFKLSTFWPIWKKPESNLELISSVFLQVVFSGAMIFLSTI